MSLLALDPGPTQSALVVLEPDGSLDRAHCHILANADLRHVLTTWLLRHDTAGQIHTLVIEQIASYGMPVGRDIFDTVFEAGRFAQCWHGPWVLLPRQAVKLHLCGSVRANDATIRQALIDKFGPGRDTALGTKRAPGPLYRFKADLWAALALAVTYRETHAPIDEAADGPAVRDGRDACS